MKIADLKSIKELVSKIKEFFKYENLTDKPKINKIEISGDKLDSDYGLQRGIVYIPKYTLLSQVWFDNPEGGADYVIVKDTITTNHIVNIYIKAEDQSKVGAVHTETKQGSFLIHTLEKPTEDIIVDFEIKLATQGSL